MPGPYFEGQIPRHCGCHYPDVIRLSDVISGDGIDRTFECKTHGVYTKHLCVQYDPELAPELRTGQELENFRADECHRLSTMR